MTTEQMAQVIVFSFALLGCVLALQWLLRKVERRMEHRERVAQIRLVEAGRDRDVAQDKLVEVKRTAAATEHTTPLWSHGDLSALAQWSQYRLQTGCDCDGCQAALRDVRSIMLSLSQPTRVN